MLIYLVVFVHLHLAKNSSRHEGYNSKPKSYFNETKFYGGEGSTDEGTGICTHKKTETDFTLEEMLELELLGLFFFRWKGQRNPYISGGRLKEHGIFGKEQEVCDEQGT